MYLSQDEYLNFGGKITDSAVFEQYEFGAEVAIDYATFNRLKDAKIISTRVKRCMFALINLLERQEQALNLGKTDEVSGITAITNQSNDGVSVSYNGMKAVDVFDACKDEVTRIIQKYLAGEKTPDGKRLLLYRGLYRGE